MSSSFGRGKASNGFGGSADLFVPINSGRHLFIELGLHLIHTSYSRTQFSSKIAKVMDMVDIVGDECFSFAWGHEIGEAFAWSDQNGSREEVLWSFQFSKGFLENRMLDKIKVTLTKSVNIHPSVGVRIDSKKYCS
ncbi:uncharacterized protein LOC116212903 [Punica granatum]|uniref:Uncharacterized protein LOC116212755 n=1 Tax=Punica granatum TaxID=22663 RepID=A0A6P8E883_PUNGR|nr:uncharacterized protein LOC116212755 [Punica granatum]XP_031403363.1 uncharacterized protein LOC116212799 [Punica granatum]XP_031403376.1 uncharacterized protein LOC116212807 [Punica granatum]XP_031403505.1 uncharacterized protein LOC116212903 [Punica granatum]